MKHIIIFALPVFFALMYSCGTNDSKHTENTTSKIDFQTIKTGVLHGAGEESVSQGVIGVSNIQEFTDLRNKINSVNEEIEDDIISNEHFFDEEMLIFVFDKVRGTGGYTFEVEEIISNSEEHTVRVLSKSPMGPATSIMTQPFQVLVLAKTDKEFKLELI